MIILIMQILSAISLLPFLLILFVSAMIFIRLPSVRAERGIPSWDMLALMEEDGSIQPASNLVKGLRKRATGLFCAVGVIIMGFVIPYFSPESIKDRDMFCYMSFGTGCGGGWLMAFGCIHFSNLISWNLVGLKPPS